MAPRKVSWTAENMEAAVYAVTNNILPVSAAADIYRIPRRTLRDYVKKHKLSNPQRPPTPDEDLHELQQVVNDDTLNDDTLNNNTDTSWFNVNRSWYCHACHVDKMADMRQCMKCFKWYHEACVGLTSDDMDPFECPIGC